MAAPGWYPDPGQSGQLREWDGQQWTARTRPASTTENRSGRRSALWIALILVVTLVVVLVVRQFSGGGPVAESTDTSTPSGSAWDERQQSVPASSGAPSQATTIDCPDYGESPARSTSEVNGRYQTAGMSYQAVPGWPPSQGWGIPWAHDRTGQAHPVTTRWMAGTVLGELDRSIFVNPQLAAEGIIDCDATSEYYTGFIKRVDHSSAATTIDGRTAWKAVTDIYAEADAGIEGDTVQVVVVDLGRPDSLTVFVTWTPIGDQTRLALVDQAIGSLRIEG